LSVLAIVYTSLTTLRQVDLKKIIAYSSVAHIGFVTIGIFTGNLQGLEGSLLLILSHGLVSGALFFCVGVLYDRFHTRVLKYYGGLAQKIPLFAGLFLFFTLANVSLPGTSSFVAEFLILCGVFQQSPVVAVFAATGVIFGAAYGIWLCNRLVFGAIHIRAVTFAGDLQRREICVFLPLVVGTL